MAISEEEWNALPDEERGRRIEEFKQAVRSILEGYNKATVCAVLRATLDDLKKGG